MKVLLYVVCFIFYFFPVIILSLACDFALFASENVRSQILDLIPDDTVRKQKLKEVNELKQKINSKLSDISKYNKYYSKCLDDFYLCSENHCGKGLKNCVSVDAPIIEDKLLNLSLECYPEYRNCLVSSISNIEDADIASLLKQINSDKIIDMTMDRVINDLTNEYVRLMEESCKIEGGFYYNGICVMVVINRTSENYFKQILNKDMMENIKKTSENVGLILPGVALTKESITVNNVNETSNQKLSKSIFSITKSKHDKPEVHETYSLSTDFYRLSNYDRKRNIIPVDNFVFIPKGWGMIMNNDCFTDLVFDNKLNPSLVDQILEIAKNNPLCTPYGFIQNKIRTLMKDSWLKLFGKKVNKSL